MYLPVEAFYCLKKDVQWFINNDYKINMSYVVLTDACTCRWKLFDRSDDNNLNNVVAITCLSVDQFLEVYAYEWHYAEKDASNRVADLFKG